MKPMKSKTVKYITPHRNLTVELRRSKRVFNSAGDFATIPPDGTERVEFNRAGMAELSPEDAEILDGLIASRKLGVTISRVN